MSDHQTERHQLIIENVGEDFYILMSRGHHDPHEFMRKVRADGYTWPLGMPTHEWTRTIPAQRGSGYRYMYVRAKPGSRGAFPTTYAREAYGEYSYEAQVTNSPPQAPANPPTPATTSQQMVRAGLLDAGKQQEKA